MKCVYPDIDHVFDTECEGVNSLIIENPQLLYHMLMDLNRQLQGNAGKLVVSSNDTPVPVSKNVDFLSDFFSFSLNEKTLIGKVCSKMESCAMEEHYERSAELLSAIESFLYDLSFDLRGDIDYPKLSVGNIIRASGVSFCDEYKSLAEKVIDYMELVREYIGEKLFVIYGLRSFLSDNEMKLFFDTVMKQRYHVIMIENHAHDPLQNEVQYIVDVDMCEIS